MIYSECMYNVHVYIFILFILMLRYVSLCDVVQLQCWWSVYGAGYST